MDSMKRGSTGEAISGEPKKKKEYDESNPFITMQSIKYWSDPIHSRYCSEREEDIAKLLLRIAKVPSDPKSLEREYTVMLHTSHISEFSILGYPERLPSLHHAASQGHLSCVQALLSAGANPHTLSSTGYNAVFYAIYNGFAFRDRHANEIVNTLVALSVNPNNAHPDRHWFLTELLSRCMLADNLEALQILLDSGVPVGYPAPPFTLRRRRCVQHEYVIPCEPLIISIINQNFQAFKLLLLYGAQFSVWSPSYPYVRESSFLVMLKILASFSNVTLALESIKICRVLGCSLWDNNVNIIDKIFAIPKLYRKYENFVKELDTLIREPLSLKQISRIVLRNYMGQKYYNSIAFLSLPNELKNFLKLQEI